MNPKENDNEIIELTDEELDEIFADDDFDNGEEDAEIRSFYFSNPDPYAKVKPRPDDAPKREFSFDEKGSIVVKNPSAFWLPDVKIVEEHGGTEYTRIWIREELLCAKATPEGISKNIFYGTQL